MQPAAILQSIQRVLKPKRLAILEAVAIGLIAAFSAVALKQGVLWLGGWRVRESVLLPTGLLLPAVGLGGGWLAGLLLERAAPEATGSGIPQVKAALAYLPIALNLRVAVVKLLGTILTLSSGFSLGRQGPTVQIGAALAAQLSRWVPASPDHQRQLIAAGAAAGLAAGFDAPIAGVMFVIEELLHDVSSLTLGTAILASFTGGVVSRVIGGRNLILGVDSLSVHFSLVEIPFFLLLGIVVGGLAALFNRSLVASVDYSRRKIRLSLPWKIGLAGLISGVTAALLPLAFRDTSILLEFLTTENISWQMMAGAFVVQFVLTLVACSAETPGGIFVPSLVLGAAIGHLVGLVQFALLGHEPVTYAITGMGAFFGAVAKVPITAIVIVFEMTTNFDLVLPLMISSVTAYLVTERLAPGSLYTHLLRVKGVFLEAEEVKDGLWARLTATDVMQRNVETLNAQLPLHEAIQSFARSHHRGFPVVENGRLVGIVTQTDLDKITPLQLGRNAPLQEIMTQQPIAVSPGDSLTQVLYLLSRYKISRLPVVERRKLIGIITRSDILQVESDKLRGGEERVGPKPEPSYGVYQTRSPATGRGRILLPLSNPQTASGMLKLALAIAQEQQYELECLQVLLVPRHTSPAEVAVDTAASRLLLAQAVKQGQRWKVPVHTQIRTTHSVAQAILETVHDRHINLLLMGWKGSTTTPGRIFGDVVDTAIRQAGCDVVLVKLGDNFTDLPVAEVQVPSLSSVHTLLQLTKLNRWLVPIAGGPNSQHALTLLPALVSLSQQPEIRLCQVFPPQDQHYDTSLLEQDAVFLRQRTQSPVTTVAVCANSVSDAVIDMAQKDQCDVLVLGASREGMLQQAIHGNIPEAIARQSRCTVILVRKAIG
jgi:chloride channel protein, CIC family